MTADRIRWALRIAGAATAVVLVGAVLAAGLVKHDSGSDVDSALPVTQQLDRQAPELTGTTLQGRSFDLRDLRGHIVVINVLASWCAPCRAELPELVVASQRYADSDVRIVGLAMRDQPGDTAKLLQDTGGQDLTVVSDPDGTRAVSLGVRGVPESFVVDRTGALRLHAFGPITADWLDRHLPALDTRT